MVADTRFNATNHLRSVVAIALYPVQWLINVPVTAADIFTRFLQDNNTLQNTVQVQRLRLTQLSERSLQVEHLTLENYQLKQLLELKTQSNFTSLATQVLFEAPDPFTRKVVVDKGSVHGVQRASPVIDAFGVIGQITRIYPTTSEVTLLIDKDHAIPILNSRTGARSVAYGDPINLAGSLELRFMATNSDVLVGDLLTTSGIDGVYPPGIPVAKISKIERRADSAFAKIFCIPVGKIDSTSYALILNLPIANHVNTLLNKDPSFHTSKHTK